MVAELDTGGDLFDLATALAGLVGAPITIEDPDTIVIAYSGGDQAVDQARIDTILGRQVPVHYREAIAATGVFERLASSDEVTTVDLPDLEMVPRAVVAVRDRGRLVGSIWAAIPGGPSEVQRQALTEAAPVVAARLRLEHDRADAGRRERADVVSTLLHGGEDAEQVAAERGMSGPWSVVAIRGTGPDVVRRLVGPLTLHLTAIAPSALAAALDAGMYAVLPASSAERILGDFLRRYGGSEGLVVGIGCATEHPGDLGESRLVADQVADALARRRRTGTVAGLDDALGDVLVDRLEGFLNRHRHASPLTRLERHDRDHAAGLVDAVRAFLDAGEVSVAAAALNVHPNTVRNRLRRAKEHCAVDLSDPATRMVLMVDLRVVR